MNNAYFLVPAAQYFSGYAGVKLDFYFVVVLMNLFICVLLFLRPSIVIFNIDVGVEGKELEGRCLAKELQRTGIILIGVFLLFDGLRGALDFYTYLTFVWFRGGVFSFEDQYRGIISVALGIGLILASGRILRIVTWLRNLQPEIDADRDKD